MALDLLTAHSRTPTCDSGTMTCWLHIPGHPLAIISLDLLTAHSRAPTCDRGTMTCWLQIPGHPLAIVALSLVGCTFPRTHLRKWHYNLLTAHSRAPTCAGMCLSFSSSHGVLRTVFFTRCSSHGVLNLSCWYQGQIYANWQATERGLNVILLKCTFSYYRFKYFKFIRPRLIFVQFKLKLWQLQYPIFWK